MNLKDLLESRLKNESKYNFYLSGTENLLSCLEACSIRIQIKETCGLKGNPGSGLFQDLPKLLSSTYAAWKAT